MLRTRVLSFTFGFLVAGAVISRFVWRDLWTERYSLHSDMKHKFDELESRISDLESISYRKSQSIQDEG